MAYWLKECLRRIFESHATKDLAQKRLDKWQQIAKREKLFPEFGKTLANWAYRITNYFHQRTTSGIIEGINNKIKLIKRRAFGFRNFEYFRIRVMAVFV
jgi:transposase